MRYFVGHAAVCGVVHEADEGAAAHIWQILMAGQIPFVIYFMSKWLANFAAVYWINYIHLDKPRGLL